MAPRSIGEVMTKVAYSVGDDQSVAEAALRMRELEVRHLPVMRGSRLVGIVSDRDLALLEGIAKVHPAELRVADAMTRDPYTVGPEVPLAEAASEMARRKIGAVVVVAGSDVRGMFTTTDALRLLANEG